jgi:hypothetical protein
LRSAGQCAALGAALAFIFALVCSFLLGCATLAVAFLSAPSMATVAGHMAAMFSFPVWFLAVLILGAKRGGKRRKRA